MLNLEKTKIVKVFSSAKDAATDRQFKNGAAISRAIRKGTKSGGHYFKLWFDCEQQLKDEYLKDNQLPVKKPTKNSKQIQRIDAKGNIKMYGSAQAVIREIKVGRKTLYDAIQYEYILKGYKWKFQ